METRLRREGYHCTECGTNLLENARLQKENKRLRDVCEALMADHDELVKPDYAITGEDGRDFLTDMKWEKLRDALKGNKDV